MHRSDFYWSVLTLLGVLLASAGCRSQPTDGHVQISPGPRTFSHEVEPPASRLGSVVAGSPGTQRARRVDPAGPKVGERDASGNLVLIGANAAAPAADEAADGAADGASLSDTERAALIEAFRDASPEIRALAEQRLAAHRAKQAAASAVTAAKPAQPAAKSAAQPAADEAAPAGTPASENTLATTTATAAAVVADTAAEEAGLPSLEDSESPAAAPGDGEKTASAEGHAADETKVAKEEGTDTDAVNVRQANGEDKAENKGEVKTVAATSAPAAGADPLAAASEEQLFQQLIARYEKRLQDETRGESLTSDLVTLRTLTTLSGNPDSAVTPVEGWDTSEQEFLNYQMLALWQMVDPQAHPVRGRRWTMALPELRQATNHLAAATGNLEVRGMAFCTEVLSYGQIKPFPTARFTAGQQVILYSELENFVAERLSDGYETHFQGTCEIFDSSGKRVASEVLEADRQICNNYRRDYYLAYIMTLSSRLDPGSYRLELTIEDMKGKKYGQGSIPLEIVK